jgi:hypothetical protein
MLDMALGAGHFCVYVRRMVRGPVMAGKTRRIRRASRIPASLPHMAGGALFFENGVSLAQSTARINSVVPSQNVPANPHQRNRRRKNRQP